ncbi:hypothetical protein ACIF9R_09630 [Streptomyces sp. NPDC086080]|uniref:hypothetical protein n=1 Tax=Streptomyces sp. NPDC086080 TaxID=3365748 RepID=UPI0037D24B5E
MRRGTGRLTDRRHIQLTAAHRDRDNDIDAPGRRGGVLALVAAFAALAALWALIPEPRTGAGSVDVTRLMPADG